MNKAELNEPSSKLSNVKGMGDMSRKGKRQCETKAHLYSPLETVTDSKFSNTQPRWITLNQGESNRSGGGGMTARLTLYRRRVAQAFQPAGSGDFPVARPGYSLLNKN